MSLFYIAANNEQEGPYSLEELRTKNIKKGTLVWTEGLDNWTKIENINELSELFTSTPPPLPKTQEKVYKAEAEISKKRKNPINTEIEIIAANEIKTNFQLIIYALIIGIVSFPIFYFGIYNAQKYDDADLSKTRIEQHGNSSILIYGVPYGLFNGYRPSVFDNSQSIKKEAIRRIENRKKRLREKSFTSTFITFLVSAGLIILIRYLSHF